MFDDPVSRTRMAWSRTLLVTAVLTALLVRAVVVVGKPWPIAIVPVGVASILMVLSFARMRLLAKHPEVARANVARRTTFAMVVGVLMLAACGVAFAFV